MVALFRSALMMAVGAVIAVSVSAVPTRAADDSKALIDELSKRVEKLEKKLTYVRVEKGTINASCYAVG